ncbi:MAG: hypothetical protein VX672_06550, partial [Planctomycetota bacterium]|nr:hypothetical protein [Planctomycetota bacterium]
MDAGLARIRHGLDPGVDLRSAGVSSMDLLDLELALRRETGRSLSLDAIEDPLTRRRIVEALIEAP